MLKTLSSQQFVYWLERMDISYEEAARLLNVSVATIERYAYGIDKVPAFQAHHCQLLLRLKSERLKEKSTGD